MFENEEGYMAALDSGQLEEFRMKHSDGPFIDLTRLEDAAAGQGIEMSEVNEADSDSHPPAADLL